MGTLGMTEKVGRVEIVEKVGTIGKWDKRSNGY